MINNWHAQTGYIIMINHKYNWYLDWYHNWVHQQLENMISVVPEGRSPQTDLLHYLYQSQGMGPDALRTFACLQ